VGHDRSDDLGIASLAALAVIVLGALLTPLRSTVDNRAVAVVLAGLVAAVAMFGGRLAGVTAGIAAAVTFDFFHTEPYLLLSIKGGADMATTALLAVVGVVAGDAAARLGIPVVAPGDDTRDVVRLWRVAELAAVGGTAEDVETAVRAELLALLHLADCRFVRGVTDAPVLDASGYLEGGWYVYGRNGLELAPDAAPVALPVRADGVVFGHLVCHPVPGVGVSAHQRLTAIALADQLALVLVGSLGQG
jgi:hypothetical protein